MHYVEFEFAEFTLQPGTYWILVFRANARGGFYWGNSTVALGSDIYTDDLTEPSWMDYVADFGEDTGTAAVDIFGRPAN